MLKYLILLGLMVLAKSQDLCVFDKDHIQGLVDRAQQFREKYNYGMINSDENDHKVSEAFVKRCNVSVCFTMFVVANSSFIDMIYGNYRLGEDHLYDGTYFRGRGKWSHGSLDECRFEVTAETGFNGIYYDYSKFNINGIEIKLPTNNLSGNIENLVSLAGQYPEFTRDYLRDLFQAHRNAFDFLKKLSKEYRDINFKSDMHYENDGVLILPWKKAHVFQLYDNDKEKVYVTTRGDGVQRGTYNCDLSQNQDFNITSGVVALSGDKYEDEKSR